MSSNMETSNQTSTIEYMQTFYGLAVISPHDIQKIVAHNPVINRAMNKVLPLIQSKDINVFIIPLPPGKCNRYWSDFSHSYILKYYDTADYLEKQYVIMTIYLNDDLSINKQHDITIEHSLHRDNEMLVYDLFILHLPYHFSWTGKREDNMFISYEAEQY